MAKPTSIRNSFKSNKICFRATQPNKLSLYMLFATHRAHSLFFNDKLFFLSINSVQTSWGFIKTDLCVVRGHAVQKTNLNAKVILRCTDRSFQRIPFRFLHHISATPPEMANETTDQC